MPLKFNNTEIPNTANVTFNGQTVNRVLLNGSQVWEKGSPGVAAKGDLVLPYMTNLVVWAYFKGVWIYAADGTGVRMWEIKQYFDDYTVGQGYSLTYQGTTFHLESPQATGGDHNGEQLVIEYRSRFSGPADQTYVLTLAGGSNAY